MQTLLLSLLLTGLLAGCSGSESPGSTPTGQSGQAGQSGSAAQAKEYQEAEKALAEIEASLKLLVDAPAVNEADADSF